MIRTHQLRPLQGLCRYSLVTRTERSTSGRASIGQSARSFALQLSCYDCSRAWWRNVPRSKRTTVHCHHPTEACKSSSTHIDGGPASAYVQLGWAPRCACTHCARVFHVLLPVLRAAAPLNLNGRGSRKNLWRPDRTA